MKEIFGRVALVAISLVLSLAAVEAGLRYYFLGRVVLPDLETPAMVPHETRSFAFRPGVKGWFMQQDALVSYRINSAGFRGPEIDRPKRRFRILVVGDSEVAGSAVEQSDLFTILLERELGAERFEVINGGVPAYNSVQTLLALQEHTRQIEPDLVIFALTAVNDIQATSRDLRNLTKKNFRRAVAFIDNEGALQIDYSAAERYFEKNRHRLETPETPGFSLHLVAYDTVSAAVKRLTRPDIRDPNVLLGRPFLAGFSPEYSEYGLTAADYERLWTGGWEVTKKILLQAGGDAEAAGAQFAVMAVPGRVQVVERIQQAFLRHFPNLKLDLTRINRELAQFAGETGMVNIDLLTPMIAARDAGEARLFHKFDQHLAKAGHVVIARAIAGQLKEAGVLDRGRTADAAEGPREGQ